MVKRPVLGVKHVTNSSAKIRPGVVKHPHVITKTELALEHV
jgi:hypothetical protein